MLRSTITSNHQLLLQAFNEPFIKIIKKLKDYSLFGITHIQVSPVQPHCGHISGWHRVYQPVSYGVGNSLGSLPEFQQLISEAKKVNIRILVDVVLHHKGACPLCNPSLPALNFIYSKFKQVLGSRLGRYQPINSSRFEMLDWGPKEDISNPMIFQSQVEFLKSLIALGIGGLRFDAAKHLPPQYWTTLLDKAGIRPNSDFICYGEVLDGSVDVCNEYISDASAMRVSDFPLTFALCAAMKFDGNLTTLEHVRTVRGDRSIVLADCHDSLLGNTYRFDGGEIYGILALCYLLGRYGGAGQQHIPLIPITYVSDRHVLAAISFFHYCHTTQAGIYYHPGSSKVLLILQRGYSAFMILNKSSDWINFDQYNLHGLESGDYREFVYDFAVRLQKRDEKNTEIVKWGESNRGGFKIGPKEVLFVVKR